jgi:hypothetical protein
MNSKLISHFLSMAYCFYLKENMNNYCDLN